jgi:GntR family transcriptional regulator, histidine utilization repressor
MLYLLCILINKGTNERVTEKLGFREIKREVFRRIRNNEWQPGALLPGEVDLAAEFGCARATVNRAMQELSDDGIIERRRKGGSRVKLAPVRQVTFEIPLIRAEVEARGAEYRYELISSTLLKAPSWLVARLNLELDAQVLHVQCLHYADGASFQYEDRWINLIAVPRATDADFSKISPNEWLVHEVPYTNAEVRFSASNADPIVSKFLKVVVGEPTFLAERTTWLAEFPVTYVRLYFARGYQMVARY